MLKHLLPAIKKARLDKDLEQRLCSFCLDEGSAKNRLLAFQELEQNCVIPPRLRVMIFSSLEQELSELKLDLEEFCSSGALSKEKDHSESNYAILNLIGRGGMGEVYRAFDQRLNRLVAIKLIHKRLCSSTVAIHKFISEAQIISQLEHPNIIPVHDIGQLSDGRYFYTMKEVKGANLAQHIAKVHSNVRDRKFYPSKEGISFRQLLRMFHQICLGVGYAHKNRVIHRDLKPANIMIGEHGEVLIMDWGLAKIIDGGLAKILGERETQKDAMFQEGGASNRRRPDQTQYGMILGTPTYMAPEQARGENDHLDARTDVFALGVILYRIITNTSPYPDKKKETLIAQIQERGPTKLLPPSAVSQSQIYLKGFPHLPAIPTMVLSICDRALSFDPEQRFVDATEMADALFWCLDI